MRTLGLVCAAIACIAVLTSAGCSNQMTTDLSGPLHDAATQPDAAAPDLACVPNQGPGCCYPTCQPEETLTCLGDNICGYPCHCDKRGDGFSPQDLACTPNQGPGCCYPTCQPGQALQCLGANICGYPCACVPVQDGGTGADAGALLWYSTCGDPVCGGHRPSGLPPCKTEMQGQACTSAGQECDPNSACNSYLVCATSDPKSHGCPISSRRYKSDIRYLGRQDLKRYYDEVQRIRLATYRYTQAGPAAPQHLDFILEDQGRSASVDRERDMVDLYGFTSLAVAAVRVQAQELTELRRQVEELRREVMAARGAGPTRRR